RAVVDGTAPGQVVIRVVAVQDLLGGIPDLSHAGTAGHVFPWGRFLPRLEVEPDPTADRTARIPPAAVPRVAVSKLLVALEAAVVSLAGTAVHQVALDIRGGRRLVSPPVGRRPVLVIILGIRH